MLSFRLICVTLLLGVFAASSSALHIQNIPCSGVTEEAEVHYMDISPCEQEPCRLSRGSTYNFDVSFTTGGEPPQIFALTTGLYGIILGLPVPFPGFNQTDACKDCNLVCPLEANHPELYKLSVYIDPELTIPISIVVKMEMKDQTSGGDLMCRMFQVEVV